MSSYVNAKAITLISLFLVLFKYKSEDKSLGHSQAFKYSHKSLGLHLGSGQDLKNMTWHLKQHWTNG